MSCDEYPFASTLEGAKTSGYQDFPRTAYWCHIPTSPLESGSSIGFSHCMINDQQNRNGGSKLGTFYGANKGGNRVLAGDKFYVKITP